MDARFVLPAAVTHGAEARGNEYGWTIVSFPDALAQAEMLGYACLGEQFQFRLESGTYEMYWLNADAGERAPDEPWPAYSRRSCREVLSAFITLLDRTDFKKEASNWPALGAAVAGGFDLSNKLRFVAYFVDEIEALNPTAQ